MFDIGFAELVLIGVVGLLVIGPERLPETIRTASLWLNRIKRGFNDIKQEVQQELHNDAVMQDLRKTGEQLKQQTDAIGRDIKDTTAELTRSAVDEPTASEPTASAEAPPPAQSAEKGPE